MASQSKAEIAAQQEYFQRANGPVIGGRTSLSSNPDRLLKEYQALGRIPKHYTSWAQINSEFSAQIEAGLTEGDARIKLGLTYQTPTGEHIISKYDRYGKGNYINARNINEDLHPEAEKFLSQAYGPEYVQEIRDKGMHDWGNKKAKIPDVMSPTAKQDADAVRDRMTSEIGRTNPRDSAAQMHRGHGFSASQSNAGPNKPNVPAEWGPYNTGGHAGLPGNPRYHPDPMHDLNLPPTMEAAVYYDRLDKEGLNLLPYDVREQGDFVAADEWQQVKGKGPGVQGNYEITASPEPARYPAESILARAEERLRAGMNPGQRQAAADAQSTLLDTTNSVSQSGPVRSTQVVTPEVTAKLQQNLTPEEARRVTANLTTQAATRGTVPQPIPQTTAKPAQPQPIKVGKTPAKPQIPVGQSATLNGKPVVWTGKSWAPVTPKPVPKPEAAKPAAKPASQGSRRGAAKPAAKPKPVPRPRGTAGVQLTDIAPPSTERFGPGGMMSTIDQPHERQFQWRR